MGLLFTSHFNGYFILFYCKQFSLNVSIIALNEAIIVQKKHIHNQSNTGRKFSVNACSRKKNMNKWRKYWKLTRTIAIIWRFIYVYMRCSAGMGLNVSSFFYYRFAHPFEQTGHAICYAVNVNNNAAHSNNNPMLSVTRNYLMFPFWILGRLKNGCK